MQFLFPGVLWGLLAVSIPVIVHLFNFRKTRKIFFSNVSFLKTVETQTSSFRKLKHLLILAARMLFIACLVLAFAQPFIHNPSINAAQNKGINSMYLDNSLSMQNTTQNKRFLDLAVIKIDELLSVFKTSSNIQLITNDFSGDEQFTVNAGKIKDRLTTLDFATTPRSYEQIYKRQKSLAQKHSQNEGNNFFWFSDFQKSTSGDLKSIQFDSLNRIFVVPVQGSASKNVFVDSVWLSSPMIREMQNNVLQVKVFNSGDKAVEKLPLKLFLDDTQSSTSSVNIPANGSATASFNFTVRDKGYHKGKITFDDQPVVFDNEYYFVLNASPSLNILHLFQQKSPADYIGKMYHNDSLFNYKTFSISNVDPGQFQNADLILLEGISSLDGSIRAGIEKFVSEGGSVFISPSETPDVSNLNGFLGQYGIQGLTFNKNVVTLQGFVDIAEPDKSSPFYSDVFERSNSNGVINLPKAFPEIGWSGIGQKLLNFKNGQPFLSQTSVGNGYVYLMASPLSGTYGNFAEHAFFVPTMFKIAAMSSKSERIAYNFSEKDISFFMPNAPKNANYKLKSGDFEIIPIQRLNGKVLYLELPNSAELSDNQVLKSGYFDLQINGKTEKVIALNHDNEESKMDTYSPEELKNIFAGQKNVTVYDNLLDGDFIDTFRENTAGKSLWKYFLIAALAFLLTEILLIRFFKG